jgi:hypothetical protein
VNISKATIEGLFVDELALLQPSAGYMRLVNDRILHIWHGVRAEARERAAEANRQTKALTDKLDRLDEAFLFSKSVGRSVGRSIGRRTNGNAIGARGTDPRQDRSAFRRHRRNGRGRAFGVRGLIEPP